MSPRATAQTLALERGEPARMVDEEFLTVGDPDVANGQDHEPVVAGVDLGVDLALEPHDRAVQQKGAVGAIDRRQTVE
ncbi:MAG: hypothetical protein REI45_12575, partial [Propionicimonas sp.]|nr:hypothetical protein [Propionicimonas sp.]